jgi:hypothetical protein
MRSNPTTGKYVERERASKKTAGQYDALLTLNPVENLQGNICRSAARICKNKPLEVHDDRCELSQWGCVKAVK